MSVSSMSLRNSSSFRDVQPGDLPALVQTDGTHQRASIIIATAVLLFTALLFAGPRLWVRQHPDHDRIPNARGLVAGGDSLLGLDDWLLVTAIAFYIIHAALMFSACVRGLGNMVNSMGIPELEAVKTLYHASNVFYVLAICTSKASVSWLMVRINSSRAPLVTRLLKGTMAFVVLWTVAMVFLMLFACPMGRLAALSTEQCPVWFSKWLALAVGGSCLEVAITMIAVWNVWGLSTTFMTKALVVALFGLRLPYVDSGQNPGKVGRNAKLTGPNSIIPLFATQLSSFQEEAFNADPTHNITLFVCLSELVLSYNICSANFPAFRRLTNDIRTNFGGFTSANLGNTFVGWAREPELDTIPTNESMVTVRSAKRHSNRLQASELTGRHEDYTVEVVPGNGDGKSVNTVASIGHESTEMIIRTRTDVVVRSDSGGY